MLRSLTRWLAVVAWAGVLAACSSNGGPGTPPASPPGSSATTAAAGQAARPGLVEVCPSTSGVRARSMWFKASDGVRLYGIEAGTGRTAVVLAHEGGADLCGWLPYARTLQDAGLRVFAFDFRGYGLSASPSSADLALGRDLAGAVTRVRAGGAAEVFLMGASMGGAAVVQNSAGIDVAGRISLSGTRLGSGYGVNDPAGVRRVSAPFLYVGTRDHWRAPRPEARSVFGMIGSADKKIVLYPGSDHGWALVEQPPYGAQTRALILKWIRARSPVTGFSPGRSAMTEPDPTVQSEDPARPADTITGAAPPVRTGMFLLELVPVPVSDIDRAKTFYAGRLGFHVDVDARPADGVRVVQLTPPGSACSITLTTGIPWLDMPAGSLRGLHLVVSDIEEARAALLDRGAQVGPVEDLGGVFYASFADPDGNTWTLQHMPWRI